MYSTAPANWTLIGGDGLIPLQRCSRFIQQPQPIELTLVGMVLFLCRDAVGIFNSPSQLDSHWWGWSYSSAEMQSVYSTSPANWTLIGGDGLFLCRDVVGVFNSPSQLNSHWWGWSYSSAEMQSVYSTAPANWTLIGGDGLIPLQRCSRCIQHPQPIGLSLVGMVYSSAEM